SNLFRLRFHYCDINNDQLEFLAKYLGSNLIELQIVNCDYIEAIGLKSVAEYCSNLQQLNVSMTGISEADITQLNWACSNTLKHLQMKFLKIFGEELYHSRTKEADDKMIEFLSTF